MIFAEGVSDPVDWHAMFDYVGHSLKEAMAMIKKDAAAHGIDITNIDQIQEPPPPAKFGLYRAVKKWAFETRKLMQTAEIDEEIWLYTNEGEDLSWYSELLPKKVYRQLCNRWHLKVGDSYGEFDLHYTKYVLTEVLKTLQTAISTLTRIDSPQKWGLLVVAGELGKLSKRIERI